MVNKLNTSGVASPSRADEIVDLIGQNIRAFNASPRQAYNPLDDHRRALECDMEWQACTSPSAALLKLCLIRSTAEAGLSHLAEGHYEPIADAIDRQVGTLIRWIEKEFGISREALALDYYHTDRTERHAWGLELNSGDAIPA